MRKYQCNACGIHICTAECQRGIGVPFKCTGIVDGICKPQWKEIVELPKLTEKIFDRPKKNTLPDWCKVGEWVYYRGYRKISEVNDFGLVLESAHCCNLNVYPEEIGREVKQARLRAYNAGEMKGLIGKVLTRSNSRSNPFSLLVVYADGNGNFIESHRFKYTAKELKDFFTINGNPCGVLEHFEEGEWVR